MFPYFETILDHLQREDPVVRQALGAHVHWGYWDDPATTPAGPDEFHRAAEAMLQRMVGLTALRDGMAILDVGCGLGGTVSFLDRQCASCTLVGVNIDAAQLRIAKTSASAQGRNSLHFIQANAGALPFQGESIDVILCVESIFHFDDRQIFLDECGRVLKPGGLLVVSDFVPIGSVGKLLDLGERLTHLVGRMYGKIDADISVLKYRVAARASGMECVTAQDVTANTLPTYRFLRNNFHRTNRRAEYDRATLLLQLFAKTRLVRYLILVFRKTEGD